MRSRRLDRRARLAPRLSLGAAITVTLLAAGCSGSWWSSSGSSGESPEGTASATGSVPLDGETNAHRNGALRISANFYPDPYTISGVAGGSVDASYLGNTPSGPCLGMTEATPNHRLTLNEDFEYLRFDVTADADTTLLLQGPTGWLCNDDTNRLNPRIEARLAAGTYRLWVGTTGRGVQPAYELSMSAERLEASAETPPAEAPAGAELDVTTTDSRFEAVGLSAGFRPDPVEIFGRTGAGASADYLGFTASGACRGQTDTQPAHLLTLHSDFDYLRLSVDAQGDAALVVQGPSGWLCNTGEEGRGVAVEGPFQAGVYRVWVTEETGSVDLDYRLAFSHQGGGGGAVGSTGELDAEASRSRFNPVYPTSPYAPDPQVVAGTAGGPINVGYLGFTSTGECSGWAEEMPNHVMLVDTDLDYLELTTDGDTDLSLVILGPDGWLCVAGHSGRGPELQGAVAAGDYRIWVAAPDPGDVRDYRLSFSAAGSTSGDVSLDTTSPTSRYAGLSITPGATSAPYLLTGAAGGEVSAAGVGQTESGPCGGYVDEIPSHLVTLTGDAGRVRFEVASDQDTTLIIYGPGGWLCNDDSAGLNPALDSALPAGQYRVWVGAGAAGFSPNYTLTITERGGPPIPMGGQLDTASARSRFGGAVLTPGFLPDPIVLEGTSGGAVDMSYLGTTAEGACVGFAETEPSHLVTVSSELAYLRVDVQSSADTTLAIHGPNGWRCVDDAVGYNPRADGPIQPGTYRIWVGSFHASVADAYQIYLSEYQY